MKLRVTFVVNCDQFSDKGNEKHDILLTINPTSLIGDIAYYLCYKVDFSSFGGGKERQKPAIAPTLCIIDRDDRIILRPHQLIRDCELTDGMTIGIMPHIYDSRYLYLEKVLGTFSDAATNITYPLYKENYFGRASSNDQQSSNPIISRNHCVLHISLSQETCQETCNRLKLEPTTKTPTNASADVSAKMLLDIPIEIEDLGAKNTARLISAVEDISSITQNHSKNKTNARNNYNYILQISEQKFHIELFSRQQIADTAQLDKPKAAQIISKHQLKWVNRGYLIPQMPEAINLKQPKKNKPTKPQPLNIASLLVPILLGGVLYFVMPNPMTMIFLMLSPLMMLTNWLFSKVKHHKEKRHNEQEFEVKLIKFEEKIKKAKLTSLEALKLRHPPLELVKLWQKHKDDADWSDFRIGSGEVKANISVDDELVILKNAPLTVNLEDNLSLCASLKFVNNLIATLITAYSPAEMQLGVIASDNQEIKDLEWLKWTNHLNLDLMSNDEKSQSILLEKLHNYKRDNKKTTIILIAGILAENYGALENLISTQKDNEIHSIWLNVNNNYVSHLSRTLIYYENKPYLIKRGSEISTKHFFEAPPQISTSQCENITKTMINCLDLSEVKTDDSRIPPSFTFESLLNYDILTATNHICSIWQNNEQNIAKNSPLKCSVGMSSKNVFDIDLRVNGPHALIGGTTGAGKSEFLQTWITSLALNTSPYRLNFLLVDYKGGSAFDKCSQFPHTVGMITDLDPHLTKRVTTSLHAELVRREKLLKQHHAKDISTLEAQNKQCILANLVIVVDEFAALAKEMPEFVDEIVDIAARGRSLGIHLIMATQRPSGVIKDNIKANTNLRIALRVADQSESNEIIGIKDAAFIKEELPGRFYAKFGGNTPIEVQSAYVGYNTQAKVQNIDIQKFTLADLISRMNANIYENNTTSTSKTSQPEHTFLHKVTKSLQYSYMEMAYSIENNQTREAIHRPWLEPLNSKIPFECIMDSGGDAYVALLDDINNCSQPKITAKELIEDNNVIITGKNGSGKTNALEVIIAGIINSNQQTNNYFINCAKTNQMLNENDNLQIIYLENTELLFRLLKTISEGKYLKNNEKVMLFIDRIDLFKEALETPELQQINAIWGKLLSNSSAYNLQIIASQGRIGGIYQNWLSFFPMHILLELASESEYNIAGIKSTDIIQNPPSGRGITTLNGRKYEMQFYYLDTTKQLSRQVPGNNHQIIIKELQSNYIYQNNVIAYDASTLEGIDVDKLQNISTQIFIVGKNSSGKTNVANLLGHVLKKEIEELSNLSSDSEIAEIIAKNPKGIITVPHNTLQGNWALLNAIRGSECVILLNINAQEASSILPLDLPNNYFVVPNQGRGYLIMHGNARYVQFAGV